MVVDASGNIYVADYGNNRIRKVTPSGVVTTFAGSGTSGEVDGTGTAAQFNGPYGLAMDSSGTIYVADRGGSRIRKITPSGVVTTLAGSTLGYNDGTGSAAQFASPQGIAVDSAGTVYVASYLDMRIRKITPSGTVSTFVGVTSPAGYADGTGTAARFNYPNGLAVDTSDNVYVADSYNGSIRKITPDGVVTTLAGNGTIGFADGGGTSARFNDPMGIAVDDSGVVYVVDQNNHRVCKITQ
jgi:sugar lactone lactonase YvrE